MLAKSRIAVTLIPGRRSVGTQSVELAETRLVELDAPIDVKRR